MFQGLFKNDTRSHKNRTVRSVAAFLRQRLVRIKVVFLIIKGSGYKKGIPQIKVNVHKLAFPQNDNSVHKWYTSLNGTYIVIKYPEINNT